MIYILEKLIPLLNIYITFTLKDMTFLSNFNKNGTSKEEIAI